MDCLVLKPRYKCYVFILIGKIHLNWHPKWFKMQGCLIKKNFKVLMKMDFQVYQYELYMGTHKKNSTQPYDTWDILREVAP